MLAEKESESIHSEHPLLLGLILTLIYGFIVYLPDFLDLKHILFAGNLSPFASIFFVFVSRFAQLPTKTSSMASSIMAPFIAQKKRLKRY